MAVAELEQFEAGLRRLGALEMQAGSAAQRLEEVRARHAAAVAESKCLEDQVQAAEAAERQARADKSRLDAAEAARDAAERFDAASAILQEASAVRDRIEAGQALLATLQVPDKTLAQLESLDLDLARQRAVQSTSLPSLRLVYADPSAPAVLLDGQPLAHAQQQSFTGTIELEIADIGRLTIASQHVDNAAEAIGQLEDRLRGLLAGIGCDSISAARQRQTAAREQSNALVLDRQLLKQLAPDGIDVLRQAVMRLDAQRGDGLEVKFDAGSVLAALQAAEAGVVGSRNAAREMRPVVEAAHAEFVAAHAALAQLQAELRALEAALGPAEDRPDRQQRLASQRDRCRQALLAAETAIAPLRASTHNLAAAELTLQRLRSVAHATAQEVTRHKEALADLNGQIRIQADRAIEENWQDTRDQLAAAIDRAQRYEVEVKTLDRLRRALATARSAARDLYLKPVITELRPLIGLLFDDISVAFNETTLLPETVLRNGQEEEVERLSGGMREQLSILTRLAFARLLARNGHPAPVILDDALVYSDDDRIERMFEALHSQSRDQQIIVFSCRQRAFSRLGGNSLSMSDWSPG